MTSVQYALLATSYYRNWMGRMDFSEDDIIIISGISIYFRGQCGRVVWLSDIKIKLNICNNI